MVVVCSTVCASAPVKLPEILTAGGVISGYCAMGKMDIEISPTNTITIDITIAVTGFFIKVSAIMIWFDQLSFAFQCMFAKLLIKIQQFYKYDPYVYI